MRRHHPSTGRGPLGPAAGLALVVAFAWAGAAPAAEAAPPAADDNLVWSDEFDGTALDPAKWMYRGLGPRKGGVNVRETVALDGRGHLVLTTRKAGDVYETAMIATQGKFERAFGYFECRVRFQAQPGHWSAFWLQSPRLGSVVGDPKTSGAEIDIFEYLAIRGDKIQHTLHWDGYGKDHKSAVRVHEQPGLRAGWHTVGLEWTAEEYVFTVDGRETWRTREGVSHAPQYIILSQEAGKWAGDIARAALPDSVMFDYVRVYKRRPAVAASAPGREEAAMPAAPPASDAPAGASAPALPSAARAEDGRLLLETDALRAQVSPAGYVSGIKGGTLLDKRTGARDHSFGLAIVDFLMGPGDRPGNTYEYNNPYHGRIAKHYVEGPQVCTQAKRIEAAALRGPDFAAVRQGWTWHEPAPGLAGGSRWEQTLVLPMGRRYVLAADRVTSAGDVENVFLRIDMPGHIKHTRGDTFEEIYLSYAGRIPASDFLEDFPPDGRHLYRRGEGPAPARMIRARKTRGEGMPWLAGVTLDPAAVWEAWCHQRGYVCFIQEIGGLRVRRGDVFGAAYAVGYFDSVEEMERTADALRGYTSLEATEDFWVLAEGVLVRDPADARRFRILPQGDRPAPKTYRVLAHGRGEATINGRTLRLDGEQTFEVPARP